MKSHYNLLSTRKQVCRFLVKLSFLKCSRRMWEKSGHGHNSSLRHYWQPIWPDPVTHKSEGSSKTGIMDYQKEATQIHLRRCTGMHWDTRTVKDGKRLLAATGKSRKCDAGHGICIHLSTGAGDLAQIGYKPKNWGFRKKKTWLLVPVLAHCWVIMKRIEGISKNMSQWWRPLKVCSLMIWHKSKLQISS